MFLRPFTHSFCFFETHTDCVLKYVPITLPPSDSCPPMCFGDKYRNEKTWVGSVEHLDLDIKDFFIRW